ncbi:methyl-accepting chemotaxis protein [Patescibacteria group bacterium]|nr:methyl-accepting chemotaxis protein [Patescibacteria group bacterium]
MEKPAQGSRFVHGVFRNLLDIYGKLRVSLIGRFLAWFIFISFVPVAVVTLVNFGTSREALKNEAITKLDVVSEIAQEAVAAIIDGQMNQVKTMASNDTFLNGVNNPELRQSMNDEINFLMSDVPNFYEIFILDRNGYVVASSSATHIGKNDSEDMYFIAVKDIQSVFLKDVFRAQNTEEYGYTVSAPLINPYTKEFSGVVVGRARLDQINEMLKRAYQAVGKTADVFIVNKDAYLLTPSRFSEGNVVLERKYSGDYINKCLSGVETNGFVRGYRNVNVLGYYKSQILASRLGMKWCLVSEIDQDEVYTPVGEIGQKTIILGAVILPVILLLARVASTSIGKFIKRPIERIANQLRKASEQLAASSQQSSASSQQMASVAQQVAAGAVQQSKQAEEISSSVSEMASSIQQMSATSQEVTDSAQLSTQKAQEVNLSGAQAQKGLERISTAIKTTSSLIDQTAQKAKSIGRIIESITEVAEQTNMLALNAAIEAARAGDAGRGFAVVADEVRNLAEESRKSAAEIGSLVKDVLTSVDETVKKTRESTDIVDESSLVIETTLGSLHDITELAESVSLKIQEMSIAVQQQASAVQQVSMTLESIALVAQQNSSGSQQLSSSTQQQSAINQEIAVAAQQLQDSAAQLQELVGTSRDSMDQLRAELGFLKNRNNGVEENGSSK